MASLKRKENLDSPRPSKSSRKAKPSSQLEALPPEILQHIFFYSENVWLTQASPTILRKLSSEHVCEEFCQRVFVHRGKDGSRYMHWEDDISTVGSDPEPAWCEIEELDDNYRTRIMDSKFFTWPFFLRLLKHFPIWDHHEAPVRLVRYPADVEHVMELQSKPYPHDEAHSARILRHSIWKPGQLFWIEDANRRSKMVDAIELWESNRIEPRLYEQLSFSKIPDKLLIPPFTPDKIDLLHFLLCVVELEFATPTLTTNAIKTAIRTKEYHLLWILLNYARNEDATFEELLRTAVLDGDCDATTVQMLMDEWISHQQDCCVCSIHNWSDSSCFNCRTRKCNDDCGHPVDWNYDSDLLDKALWNWADYEKKKNNWKGEWLEMNLTRLCRWDWVVPAKEYLAIRPQNRRR